MSYPRRGWQKAGTGLVLVPQERLAALITALHRAAQRQLPIVPVGSGLPRLRGQTGRAKS